MGWEWAAAVLAIASVLSNNDLSGVADAFSFKTAVVLNVNCKSVARRHFRSRVSVIDT